MIKHLHRCTLVDAEACESCATEGLSDPVEPEDEPKAEKLGGYLLAIAIGLALAGALVKWLTT